MSEIDAYKRAQVDPEVELPERPGIYIPDVNMGMPGGTYVYQRDIDYDDGDGVIWRVMAGDRIIEGEEAIFEARYAESVLGGLIPLAVE